MSLMKFSLGSQARDFSGSTELSESVPHGMSFFGHCFVKKRLRDLPRHIARCGWSYLYQWEFPVHLTDNTDSSFLLSLGNVLILPLFTLNVQEVWVRILSTVIIQKYLLYVIVTIWINRTIHCQISIINASDSYSNKQDYPNKTVNHFSNCDTQLMFQKVLDYKLLQKLKTFAVHRSLCFSISKVFFLLHFLQLCLSCPWILIFHCLTECLKLLGFIYMQANIIVSEPPLLEIGLLKRKLKRSIYNHKKPGRISQKFIVRNSLQKQQRTTSFGSASMRYRNSMFQLQELSQPS